MVTPQESQKSEKVTPGTEEKARSGCSTHSHVGQELPPSNAAH